LKDLESKQENRKKAKESLPYQGITLLVCMIILSICAHLLTYVNFSAFIDNVNRNNPKISYAPIKFRVNTDPKKEKEDSRKKTIVEVPLEKTEKPTDARKLSFNDHKTERETKTKDIPDNTKAADAGLKGKPLEQAKKNVQKATDPAKQKLEINSADGTLKIFRNDKNGKAGYKSLMPTQQELSKMLEAGYQEYITDDIAIGDRVDINTNEYRYMGYMTSMRKAIELVWNYPLVAAQRGMQGEVGVEFIIMKDGNTRRIRVVKSSGYKILDDAIVEAIKLASPFSPLPEGFGKEKIVITGMFRYILSSYLAGAH
jgi:protein TonB